MLAGVTGWWAAGGWLGPALLAAVYVVALLLRGPGLDTSAPAAATALLLAAELAALARALAEGRVAIASVLGRRLVSLGLLALGSAAAGWFLLAAAAVPLPGGVLTTLLGAVAAIAALALAARRPA